MKKLPPLLLPALLILLTLTAWTTHTPAPASGLETAWARAQKAGAYTFTADIVQQSIPVASIANVGRTSKESALHLEGETNLADNALHFTLWSQGGNVLDSTSGYEVKVENGQTFARQETQPWQTVDSFSDSFAPAGDFLGFLTAADGVTDAGEETRTLPDGTTITFHRYTYQINGPRFAAYLRDKMETAMRGRGELLPGMELDASALLKDLRGTGELWVSADGLPLRQITHLTFPPENDAWIETDITVQFTNFERTPLALPLTRTLTQAGLLLAGAVLTLALFRRIPFKVLHLALVTLVIASILLTPLLESARAAEISDQLTDESVPDTSTNQPINQSPITQSPNQQFTQSLTTLRSDTGLDTDQDGVTDIQETFLGTNPYLAEPQITSHESRLTDLTPINQLPINTPTDSDLDTLTDYEESLLGTDPFNPDSDGDLIPDLAELEGFSHNGQLWTTDPLLLDTNNDGISDQREWNDPATFHATWDTDNDGTPDLFDTDNDGDSVPDRLDVSPFQNWDTVYSRTTPFNLNLQGLTPGETTFVEFQLRPTDPEHLWYTLDTLDWPIDDKGNLTDETGGTFPGKDGDIQLVPMLELQIPGAPSNLPLTAPVTEVTLRPFPTATNPLTATHTLETVGNDLAFTFDPADVNNVFVRNGTCANPGSLAFGPITLPSNGLTRVLPGITLDDWADGNHILTTTRFDNRNIQSCGVIRHLPFENGQIVDLAALEPFQLTVRDTTADHTTKVVYLPLNLITDPDTGARVAFNGQMVYDPSVWTQPHQVRLVWAVNMLTDNVCLIGSVNPADPEKCLHSADDVPNIIHTYDDTFTLTGLDVREDHRVDLAMVYEDPTVDANLHDDLALTMLADGLDYAFLSGRDCDTVNADGACSGNGQRDFSIPLIAQRFDRDLNDAVPEEERWDIEDTLQVETRAYETMDSMLQAVTEDEITPLLDTFTPAWTPSAPITPTILFAFEYEFRAANLDSRDVDQSVQWNPAGDTLTVNLSGAPASTITSLKMSPYVYDGQAWAQMAADAYYNLLEKRYAPEFAGDPNPDEAEGQVVAVQLYLFTLYQGFQRTVQIGNVILDSASLPDSAVFARLARSAAAGAGKFITTQIFIGRALAMTEGTIRSLWLYLKLAFKDFIKQISLAGPVRLGKFLFNKFRAIQSLRTKGSIILLVIGVVAAVTTFIILTVLKGSGSGVVTLNRVIYAVAATLMLIVGVIGPIMDGITSVTAAHSGVKAFVHGKHIASARTLTKGAKFAALIGLIIEVAVIWGYFIYAIASGEVQFGTAEFSYLVSFSVAATAVAVLFALISVIPVVGLAIVGLIAFFDLLMSLICEFGVDVDGDPTKCFGITTWLTDNLAGLLYGADVIFNFENTTKGETLDLTSLNVEFVDPNLGVVAGNAVRFIATLEMNLHPSEPELYVPGFYEKSNIQTTGLDFSLDAESVDRNATRNNTPNGWTFAYLKSIHRTTIGLVTSISGSFPLYVGRPPAMTLTSAPIPLTVGVNTTPPLYLNGSLSIPKWSCSGEFCNSGTHPVDINESINDDAIFFDVLPASLDEFHTMTWDGHLPVQLDRDGDGVLALSDGGLDPDDSTWDSDGDGLSDAFELDYQQQGLENGGGAISLQSLDTDDDGLCDAQEIAIGTRPDLADSDQDGLSDADEFFHQDLCDADGDNDTTEYVGGWLFTYAEGETVLISSNPISPDDDADGMSDLTEKILHELDPVAYPFHPNVFNLSPVGLALQTSDLDRVVLPGDTFLYTATVQNNLSNPLYADGTLDITFPAALGGGSASHPFSVFQGETAPFPTPLTSSGGSQIVSIGNDLAADIQPSGQFTVPVPLPIDFTENLLVTIDADNPTSALTSGQYIRAGGFRVIGGTANDPTSYIKGVDISFDGGAVFTPTTGAEAWAFTWNVPTTEGRVDLLTRAEDAVGHLETPPHAVTVIVDGQAPALTTDTTGNPILRGFLNPEGHWTLGLSGTAVDPFVLADPGSGTVLVEVLVEPLSNFWQTAVLNGSDWTIDYALSTFDADHGNLPVIDPTGQYTVTVRATDLVGNVTPDASLLTFPVRVDNRAPITELDPINTQITVISPTLNFLTATTFISTNLTLSGVITDPGQVASGVNELQLSFTPAELLDSLTAPTLLMYLNDPDGSTTFRDTSGTPATCAGTACPTGDAPGIYGGALLFDGNDFVDVSADLPETEYTLSVWFNTTCANCGLLQADAGTLGDAGHDRDLFLSGGNVCLFIDGTINDTFCSSGTNYADGEWHQAVHAIGASGSVLYVDGLPAATGLVTASDFNQTGMNLGYSQAGTDFLSGMLDELAVYPGAFTAEQVFSLYQNWQTVNLAQSGASVATTTWDFTIPDGLEGYYQLDLRGADVLGNRNDEQRSAYTHWQGLVDTAAPDVNMLVTYSGVGQSALTTYSGLAEDFDLVTDGYAFPCALQPDEQQMYASAWWDAISNGTPRLYQFTPSCSLAGFHTDNVFLRACDAFGRCAAATPDTYKLYFATQTGWFGDNYRIERANLFDGTAREVIIDGLDHVMGLDVDVPRGHLYWLEADRTLGNTTPVSGRIRRANLDGTNIVDVLTGLTFPFFLNPRSGGFALNAGGGKLYWSTGNQVWWANLDGTGAEVLFTIPAPQDTVGEIALDLTHAKLYWMADESGTPLEDQQIWQANLDGTGAVVLLDNLNFIVDLTVDPTTNHLYWMEQDDLFRANLDGSGIEQLNVSVSASVVNGSFAIGPVGNLAFLSNQGHIRQINLTNQQTGTLIPSINYQLAGPLTIARIPGQTFTQPDLVLDKAATSGLGVQGDTLTYQFVVRNVGLLDAANVVLTDTLPVGLGFASASVDCETAGQTVTCSLGDLASGGVFTATLTANVSVASGTLVNTASIAADNGDLSPANNTVTVSDALAVPAATSTPTSPANGRYIYWSNFFEIRRIRLDVPGTDSLVIALDSADGFVEGITVDNVNNKLYWTRPSAGLIQRANLDGTGLETFVTAAGEPRDVTVDPLGGFLYWSDVDGQVIERIALTGTGRTVIVPDALDVKDLIVDTLRGFLYWGDATGQLWRANLDGSNAESLLSDVWVFNLALDPYAERVYWINPIEQTLQRSAPDGSGLENIALPLAHPSEGLVVDAAAGKLYWAEGDTLFRANLDGTGSETVVTGLNGISSGGLGETLVQVYEPIQPPTATPTPTNTPSPTTTPTPLPPTNTPTPTTTPQPLPTSTPGGPPAADNLYWGVFGTLQRAPSSGCADGSCVSNVAPTVFGAASLALDSLHNKIYWLELDAASVIKRANLDGSNVETLISSTDPIDRITLDPEGGFLYWTGGQFSAGTGLITRANLDGTNPTVLISGLDSPSYLALDRPRNKIYWFDELNYPEKRLFRANLNDGANVELILFDDGTNNPPIVGDFVTGLAVDEAHAWLFWTDREGFNFNGRVRRADLGCSVIANCLRTMVEIPDMIPYGIALDLTSLQMYWPAALGVFPNTTYEIQGTLLDGTGTVSTVVGNLSDEPRHIALAFPPIPPTPTPTLPPTLTPTATPACVVSPDAFEPDDAFTTATEIGLESGPSVNHNFHTVSDQDWLFFDAQVGFFYTLYTRIQEPDADTVLELFDTNGTTLLASNDDFGGQAHSQLTFDPPANGRYFLRVTNISGLATCLTTYNVHLDNTAPTPIPPKGPNPPGHGNPVLDSAVQTPADDALIANTGTLNVEVGAFALDFLQTITLTVDGNVIGITTFPQDTITETTWTTPWTPGAEGEFMLVSVASDWAGRVQTDTHPIRVVVDTGLPSVSLSPTVYTTTHLIGTNQIALTGSASDGLGIAQVYVNVNGGGMQIANVNGGGWSLPWLVGAMDGLTVPVTVLATDPGGQSAQVTESVTVDVAPPQPGGSPNTDGITLTHNGDPITPTQTIYEANPTLTISWQPFTDGGGVAGYYAGWTTDITPTLSALTFYPPNATLQHVQTLGEAEVRYAHLIALDVYGNRTAFTAGPFYVDGPTTPDLVDDFDYHGWQFSGATQLGADKDIANGPLGASALGVVQNFYASWDADTLRMSWVGADWNSDGDLFIYLDTASGGADSLFNPYTPPASINLPTGMTANFLIWVEDDQTAGLYTASGNDWTLVTALTSDEFRFQSGVSPLVADLRLPFSLLGLTSGDPVKLVAVASEEDTLNLWAAAPDKNPLNSPRVINALAAGRDLSSYTLTLSAEWGGLGAGIEPNAGQFADTDLQITIASNPAGVGIGFLSSDLLDLLSPGARLDANLDGQIDLPLPIPLDQPPVGDGQTITYVIRYTNAGPATAENVVVSLEDFGAISLSNSSVTIGDLGPGESGEVTVTGTVNAGNGVSGEVRATISDAGHGDHDWAWIQHDLDNAAPTGVVILDPLDYARPFTQTVSGLAADPSGIAFVTLEFQPLTAGPTTLITCPDPTPFDGTWACAWNPGTLTGLAGMQIRVSATDLFGNESAFTDFLTLAVDDTAPTLTVDPSFDAALADGLFTPDEALIFGQVVDDQQATAFEVCLTEGSVPTPVCNRANVAPGDAPTGDWVVNLLLDGDGTTFTLRLYGIDGAGNRSAPFQRTFEVDMVPPALTATLLHPIVILPDQNGEPLLTGSVSDGGDVDAVLVRMTHPDGSVTFTTVATAAGNWTFAPEFAATGTYILNVEAWDAAGNAVGKGPFVVQVVGVTDYRIYLPIVTYYTPGP